MAKVKKKEELTLEEKLERALVPVEEQPYQVPENWCWVSGKIIFKEQESQKPQGDVFRYIDIESVDNESQIVSEPKKLLVSKSPSRANRRLHKGDTIFSLVRPYLMNIAYIDENLADCIASTGFYVCTPHERINTRYVYYLMRSPYVVNGLNMFMKGDNSPSIRKNDIEDFLYPIPPSAEQQRIVEKIESLFVKLDEAKEKAEAVFLECENEKSALLNQAFIGKLTKKWRRKNEVDSCHFVDYLDNKMSEIKRKKYKKAENNFSEIVCNKITSEWAAVDLERVSILITDGEHKTPNRVENYSGYYLLSARNIHNDELRLNDVDYVDEMEYEKISKRCNPQRGDVLISCSGSVGRCCVVEDDNKYCMVRSAAMISLLEGNPRFVMYMLQSGYMQEQIKKLIKQTAQANLFLGAISALVIPFPALEEQDEIVKILDKLFTSINKSQEISENVIKQIDLMKKSILAKAFRGELGTNNPDEESAIELLKEILQKS